MSDDDGAPVAGAFVPDLDHPLDALQFGDPTPTEAQKSLLQTKHETPTEIKVINGVTYTIPGVTAVGVEKQWAAPDITTDSTVGGAQVTHTTTPIDPIAGVGQ